MGISGILDLEAFETTEEDMINISCIYDTDIALFQTPSHSRVIDVCKVNPANIVTFSENTGCSWYFNSGLFNFFGCINPTFHAVALHDLNSHR